ncbi:MAG: ABC transporter permease, partial [Armatimonadetes bacterium]|nr:ABC transporter permease [Armatimonadota bacterium]
MSSYAAYRALHGAFVVAGVMLTVALMIHLTPGDPVMLLVGDAPVPKEQVEHIRRAFGLDRPLPAQVAFYIGKVLRGDLGRSLRSNRPVSEDIRRVVPHTVSLAIAGMAVGIAIGVPAGVYAAVRRGGWIDSLATAFAVAGVSMPTFWTGLLFISIFAVRLGWFPTSGVAS